MKTDTAPPTSQATQAALQQLVQLPARAKLALLLGADALALPLAMLAAVSFRLGSLELAWHTAPQAQLLFSWLALPALALAGLYRTVLRYVHLRVLVRAGLSLAAVVLGAWALAQLLNYREVPRTALLMFWFIAFTYVLASRLLARRLLWEALQQGRPRQRCVLYGAGAAGAQLAQAMQWSPDYQAVCFVDDAPALHGKQVMGLEVHAPARLRALAQTLALDQVVLALPSAPAAQRRAVIERAEASGLPVRTLPGLHDLAQGQARLSDLRSVELADLLGRDAVPPDPRLFAKTLQSRVVLVTGAGGSIGSELCRQVLTQRPARLVLLDHAEFALYAIEQELAPLAQAAGTVLQAVLGSVQDEALLQRLLVGVDTLYHAAAYKHVPLVEHNAARGVLNNVRGTQVVAQAALQAGVACCVLVSTDKAVRPTNVMGASKRVAELLFQAAAQQGSRTTFSMVRFGNVLGSSGSVVPRFKQQIAAGGPITLTHTEVIRYFMLIPEAAQLVIQAGALAEGGEVFVLDMGEPVRIADLARSLIRLSGLTERSAETPEGDIAIEVVGLRPGEKLYEELLLGDDVRPSGHPRICRALEAALRPEDLAPRVAALCAACERDDTRAVRAALQDLVPDYRPAAA